MQNSENKPDTVEILDMESSFRFYIRKKYLMIKNLNMELAILDRNGQRKWKDYFSSFTTKCRSK